MDCTTRSPVVLFMECPCPSSLQILSPEKFGPVSDMAVDGRDVLFGCLDYTHVEYPYGRYFSGPSAKFSETDKFVNSSNRNKKK